jgi:cysteine desulfurase
MNKKIYLDHSATTPTDPEVLKAMKPYFTTKFGNPSSVHQWGKETNQAIEKTRTEIAQILNAQKKEEIIFTSGATEANNLTLRGIVDKTKGKHIIVSSVEHHCVLDTAEELEKQGVEVTFLPVDKHGQVSVEKVKQAIKKETVLVSIMFVNNEVGTIQPISEIGRMIKNHDQKIYFHTDAVQAVQYLDCDVQKLNVDLLSLSAHKFYGPKGMGLLYVEKGTPLTTQIVGGGQEFNIRAGTENVPGIIGMGKALSLVEKNKQKHKKQVKKLANHLIDGVKKNINDVQLTGHPEQRAPHIVSFVIKGVEGEAMLLRLDLKGIGASSGSACTSGSLKPSHVLTSMGIKPEHAHGSLRLSLGKKTTKEEINYVIKVLPGIIKNLRKMSPLS